MKDNVVLFDGVTSKDLPAGRVVMAAQDQVTDVIIIGWDKNEELYFASSIADGGEVLWLMELAKKSTGPKLILDFDNIKSISSEALGKLLTLHKTAAESGGSVSLAAMNDKNIRSVFQITQLDKVISIYASVAEAEAQL